MTKERDKYKGQVERLDMVVAKLLAQRKADVEGRRADMEVMSALQDLSRDRLG